MVGTETGSSMNQPEEGVVAGKPPQQEGGTTTTTTTTSDDEDKKRWGTQVMGAPANPTVHPDNQKAATWAAEEQQPYIMYSPMERPPSTTTNPLEPIIQAFHTWTQRADTIARNIWHNLKTGTSVAEAAWGKLNLTAKAITEGGLEPLFKQIFETTGTDEKLKKTYACYLSTTTGPVAGTLYLSNLRICFCSDRPLSFITPSRQQTWSYYKVMIPLAQTSTINPITMSENEKEKYIHITTVDNHDFWFMGFVNFDKAIHHLFQTLAAFRTTDYGPHAASTH